MYKSDITDEQWVKIEGILKPTLTRGCPRSYSLRSTVEAIFYLNKTGLPWRKLPAHFPPFSTVHYNYKKWEKIGTWEKVLEFLNIKSQMPVSSKYNVYHTIFIEMFEKGYSQNYISDKLEIPISSINKMVKKYYIKKYVRRK